MKLPKELREKKDLAGAANKGKTCSVIDCSESAIRSLSENTWNKYIEKTGLKIEENKQHKIFLCKAHYKEACHNRPFMTQACRERAGQEKGQGIATR